MHDRFKPYVNRFVGAITALTLAAGPLSAAPDLMDKVLREKLRSFDALLTDALPNPSIPANSLIFDAGLAEVTNLPPTAPVIAGLGTSTPAVVRPIQAKAMDLRLAMAMISQIYGAKDNLDVVFAQPDPQLQALMVESGDITISDIFEQLAELGLQDDMGAGRNLLRVPVVIWSGARLRMEPGEHLLLSRTDGAALFNFGRLEIDGATVRSEGDATTRAPDFIPFIANGGGASVRVRNAHFDGLGFGNEIKFSGFSVVRNPLLVRKDEIIIEHNTFTNVVGVSVSMSDGAVVRNNRIHNTRGASLVLTHSLDGRIAGNLITGHSPTNAIRILQGSSRAMVSGNVIMNGDRVGISVRNDSEKVQVTNNVIWQRGGGGISIARLSCAVVRGNLVMDNRQKGIEVSTVRNVSVTDNLVIGNRSAGIWVSKQEPGQATRITGNVLIGNSAGLGAASGQRLAIEGNDFSRQFPQFVSGDLAPQARVVAANLTNAAPVILTAGGTENGPLPEANCKN